MTTHTRPHYSAPKRRWRLGLKITDGDLKTRTCFGTWEHTYNCGCIIALFATKPNLVLLTSWVSYLGNYILMVSLTNTPTKVADTPLGWASKWLRYGLTLFGLTDAPSKVTDTLVGTRRFWVCWVTESINQWTLRERSWTLRWGLCALGLWG